MIDIRQTLNTHILPKIQGFSSNTFFFILMDSLPYPIDPNKRFFSFFLAMCH